MGQLIKLENYISRYQRDIYHYSSQYIRLKQENWKGLLEMWEAKQESLYIEETNQEVSQASLFEKWKEFFNKREEVQADYSDYSLPKTEDQLKYSFLDSIYQFQLNWASSTISEMSFLDRYYEADLTLKYFLQRFPDTYLFMYKPVFKLKKTIVDTDIIMITPVEINVIKIVEEPSDHMIIADDDRTWLSEQNGIQSKFLSPLLSLKRSAKIVEAILDHKKIDMPIKKIVLSRTNRIQFYLEPFQTEFVDRDKHEKWLHRQRQLTSPLKHQQLKVAETLLAYSDTVAVNRPEWERSEDVQM